MRHWLLYMVFMLASIYCKTQKPKNDTLRPIHPKNFNSQARFIHVMCCPWYCIILQLIGLLISKHKPYPQYIQYVKMAFFSLLLYSVWSLPSPPSDPIRVMSTSKQNMLYCGTVTSIAFRGTNQTVLQFPPPHQVNAFPTLVVFLPRYCCCSETLAAVPNAIRILTSSVGIFIPTCCCCCVSYC